MGAKGNRRREKNYRAAHGDNSRLPPPPDLSSLDALPSKLRKIMAFASSPSPLPPNKSSGKPTSKAQQHKVQKRDDRELKAQLEADSDTNQNESSVAPQDVDLSDKNVMGSSAEKKKKKRKRKQVEDLRFESEMKNLGVVSTRRQRKKEYLKARKKKQKKSNPEVNMDFPKHEKIKFGDVVEAPPKLVIPKAFKTSMDASRERVRLKAIEAYRDRKKWTSRPGLHLPSMTS